MSDQRTTTPLILSTEISELIPYSQNHLRRLEISSPHQFARDVVVRSNVNKRNRDHGLHSGRDVEMGDIIAVDVVDHVVDQLLFLLLPPELPHLIPEHDANDN